MLLAVSFRFPHDHLPAKILVASRGHLKADPKNDMVFSVPEKEL
jgi:hypothetical protein